ncbi:MAG: cytochrome c biogenesis factor [Pseudomonadota bacterium]
MIGGWLAILALSLASFAIAAFALRLPKHGFGVFGAVLLLGLAGYSFQGSPGKPGAPKEPDLALEQQSGEAMVAARKQLFDVPNRPNYLIMADGYAGRGKFSEAAGLLRGGLASNPDHLEGWLALGMSLTGHADGVVTPAAFYAYGRARAIDPAHPGADFFLGTSFLNNGEVRAARDTWARLLDNSPADAPWRPELERRVAQLDQAIANAPMLQ